MHPFFPSLSFPPVTQQRLGEGGIDRQNGIKGPDLHCLGGFMGKFSLAHSLTRTGKPDVAGSGDNAGHGSRIYAGSQVRRYGKIGSVAMGCRVVLF